MSRYIAIEGNIGVGKTTLAKRLAAYIGSELVLEKFRNNYFLPLFYNDEEKYALHVELSFLVDRYHDHNILIPQKKAIISDYFFTKTLLFARANLDKHALHIFERLYNKFEERALHPSLVIYLNRDIDQLLHNIKKRGRETERKIKAEYLEKVQKEYNTYFSKNKQLKVVKLDVGNLNLKKQSTIADIATILKKRFPIGTTKITL